MCNKEQNRVTRACTARLGPDPAAMTDLALARTGRCGIGVVWEGRQTMHEREICHGFRAASTVRYIITKPAKGPRREMTKTPQRKLAVINSAGGDANKQLEMANGLRLSSDPSKATGNYEAPQA